MDVRWTRLFIAGQEYTTYDRITLQPGGLRKLGSADVALKNLGLAPVLTVPATLQDTAGGNAATPSGPTPCFSPRGKALVFDGLDDYVLIPNHPTYEAWTGFSIACWIYPTLLGSVWRNVVLRNVWNEDGWVLYFESAKTLVFRVYGPGATEGTAVSLAALTEDAWYHVVGTYDGLTLRLYIDAVAQTPGSFTNTLLADTHDIWIGNSSENSMGGVVDEVRLYNRALA